MLPLKNNKKIRPSSAGGKLQTHPMYYKFVQDNKHARAATADTNFGSNYQKKDKADSVMSDGEDLDDIRLTKSDTAVTSRRMTVDSVVKLTKVPLSTFEIRPKSKVWVNKTIFNIYEFICVWYLCVSVCVDKFTIIICKNRQFDCCQYQKKLERNNFTYIHT